MFCLILDKCIASSKEKKDSISYLKVLELLCGSLHKHISFSSFFSFELTWSCTSSGIPRKKNWSYWYLISQTEIHLHIQLEFWLCIIKSIYLLFRAEYKCNMTTHPKCCSVKNPSDCTVETLLFEVSSNLKTDFNQQLIEMSVQFTV